MQQDTNHRAAVIVALARAAGATVQVNGRDAEEIERLAELADGAEQRLAVAGLERLDDGRGRREHRVAGGGVPLHRRAEAGIDVRLAARDQVAGLLEIVQDAEIGHRRRRALDQVGSDRAVPRHDHARAARLAPSPRAPDVPARSSRVIFRAT